jgi:prevent-host-death family protein
MPPKKATRSVGIRELKNRLPEYVRDVRKGVEIIVTDRGRPVAVLSPLDDAADHASLAARLAAVAARGAISTPTADRTRRPRRIRAAGPPLSRQILDDRG